jgi:voltage-gated potassium channel Kch
MNPKHIKEARENGMMTLYGDGANLEVMERAGIEKARAVVVSFGDSIGMAQIIRAVEHLKS